MLKEIMVSCLLFLVELNGVQAQGRFYTKTGRIAFYSNAPLEVIEAVNKTVSAVLDANTGQVQFAVLMKGFEFKKALMQEHFNENYVESHRYPKAEFRGNIETNSRVDYSKEGSYTVKVKGQLLLHNVTREIEVLATLRLHGGNLEANATFTVLASDYLILIPSLMKDKISNSVKVTVQVKLEPVKT